MNLFISSFKKYRKERVVLFIPFLIVFFVLFHEITPVSDAHRVIENNSFWKKKTFDTNRYDLVVSGDSRIYRGISPGHMQTVLKDYSIINFGYGSAGYGELMLKEIDKRIDFSSGKKSVLLGVTPLSLTHEGVMNWHLREELSTKREEILELIYFKKIKQYFIPMTLEQLQSSINGKEFYDSRKQEYMPDGWVATVEEKPWADAALQHYQTRFTNNPVQEKNIVVLLDQVKEWTSKGVKVYAMRPPTTHKLVALENEKSGFNEKEIKQRLNQAGAIWLDIDLDRYETTDGSHLQKSSAIEFSLDLASKIDQVKWE